MKIGGFGYIKRDGVLHIPKRVSESLAIDDRCILFGIYYPPSDSYKEANISYVNEHDFVFSSVRFDDWPYSARLTIRVIRQSSALKKLTALFAANNVTIVHSTSTRSGHRFSSIDFHVVFENIREAFDASKFNEEKSYYKPTLEALEKLVDSIKDKKSEVFKDLFIDTEQIYLEEPITSKVNQALHYYYWKSREKLKKEGVDEKSPEFHISKPFSLRYLAGAYYENLDKIETNSGGKIISIITVANTKDNIKTPIIPSIVFVESDTNSLHLRIRIIPRERAEKFLQIEVTHTRLIGEASTKGLLSQITDKVIPPDEYRIWSYITQVYECRDNYGAGKLTFFAETKNGSGFNNFLDNQSEILNTRIDSLNKTIQKDKTLKLGQISVHPPKISGVLDLLSEKFSTPWPFKQNYDYDVFLSYAGKDIKEVEKVEKSLKKSGVILYKAKDEIVTGVLLSEEILARIRSSREFCLIYTHECAYTNWILWELSAALALNKHISIILVGVEAENVRKDIRTRVQSRTYRSLNVSKDVDKYAIELLSRRYLN